MINIKAARECDHPASASLWRDRWCGAGDRFRGANLHLQFPNCSPLATLLPRSRSQPAVHPAASRHAVFEQVIERLFARNRNFLDAALSRISIKLSTSRSASAPMFSPAGKISPPSQHFVLPGACIVSRLRCAPSYVAGLDSTTGWRRRRRHHVCLQPDREFERYGMDKRALSC